LSSKSSKVRRSSSWRSLKERGNNYIGHFSSRTLSADELHRNQKNKRTNPQISHSPVSNLNSQRQTTSGGGLNSIRLSNCDASISLSTTNSSKRFHRLSSRKSQQSVVQRNNAHSGGGDSGYSEESFATTTISSIKRPLHTSCPHCHCEQRSSFNYYQKTSSSSSSATDSSLSDTTIHKNTNSKDLYYHAFQQKQSLSASRSYPHIKPLPKTNPNQSMNSSSQQQLRKRAKSLQARRRRHLSCDGSLSTTKTQHQQATNNHVIENLFANRFLFKVRYLDFFDIESDSNSSSFHSHWNSH